MSGTPTSGRLPHLPGRSQGAEAQLSKKDEHVRSEVSVAPICGLRGVEVLNGISLVDCTPVVRQEN